MICVRATAIKYIDDMRQRQQAPAAQQPVPAANAAPAGPQQVPAATPAPGGPPQAPANATPCVRSKPTISTQVVRTLTGRQQTPASDVLTSNAKAQQEILELQAQRERVAAAAELAEARQVILELQARLVSGEPQRRRYTDADVVDSVATALAATQQATSELHAKRVGPSSSSATETNATTKARETA
jgi:hypothetical protein